MAFPNHLLTLATLRLLTLVPANERFHSVKSDPLHVLTELTAAYLQLLAETAKSYAEQAGRISPNAIDARDAIAHFGVDINEIHEWCEDRQLGKGILRGTDGSVGELAPSADGGDAPAPNGIALQQHASNESADLGALLKGEYAEDKIGLLSMHICRFANHLLILCVFRYSILYINLLTHQTHTVYSLDTS